jgi:hypothetical protein
MEEHGGDECGEGRPVDVVLEEGDMLGDGWTWCWERYEKSGVRLGRDLRAS